MPSVRDRQWSIIRVVGGRLLSSLLRFLIGCEASRYWSNFGPMLTRTTEYILDHIQYTLILMPTSKFCTRVFARHRYFDLMICLPVESLSSSTSRPNMYHTRGIPCSSLLFLGSNSNIPSGFPPPNPLLLSQTFLPLTHVSLTHPFILRP